MLVLHNILRGVGVCVTRRYKGGRGVKNYPKKRYIIFEWPLTVHLGRTNVNRYAPGEPCMDRLSTGVSNEQCWYQATP